MPWRRVAAWVTVCAACIAGADAPGAARQDAGLEPLLSGAPTPGAMALLVRHVARSEAHHRLAAGLRDSRADVRAAAARVIHVVAGKGLVPDLAAALATEREADPALEIGRALAALGGPAHDAAVAASWTRVPPGSAGRVAVPFASVRGQAALDLLPRLRATDPGISSLTAFLVAAHPEPSVVATLIAAAIDDGDAPTLGGVLDASRQLAITVDDDQLVEALAPTREPDLRLAAARHVLRRWTSQRPLSARVTAALGAETPLGGKNDVLEARLVREFGRRAGGAPPSATREWLALFDDPPPSLIAIAMRGAANRLLTDNERRRLLRAFPNLRVLDDGPADLQALAAAPAPPRVEVLDGFPDGFISGVMATAGCDLKSAARTGLGAGAGQLTRHPDGRVRRVSRLETGVTQPSCVLATDVLLMTHVATTQPAGGRALDVGVVPFDAEYLACRSRQSHDVTAVGMSSTSRLEAPKKTRHVDPVYPPGAQQSGVEGIVLLNATIGTQGCPGHVHVLQGVDPRLDLAALLAVTRWRFTPTRIDGTAVPVELGVAVQFHRR